MKKFLFLENDGNIFSPGYFSSVLLNKKMKLEKGQVKIVPEFIQNICVFC